jgi:protoheme IX farnesyltransferase
MCEVVAAFILWFGTNLLAMGITLAGAAFYVFVYSLWLKRRSPQNIVIGGAAGAVPALVGWAAVSGSLAWAAWLMFAVVFFWTPPHFWALAIRHRADYAAAKVPMLPVVATESETTRSMLIYTGLTVAASLLIWPAAGLGLLYGLTAVGGGAVFVGVVLALHRRPSDALAGRVFGFSITYLMVLFIAMSVDVILRAG